jgi:hypothetical protein
MSLEDTNYVFPCTTHFEIFRLRRDFEKYNYDPYSSINIYNAANDPCCLRKGCTICSNKSEYPLVLVVDNRTPPHQPKLMHPEIDIVPLDCECVDKLDRDVLTTRVTSYCCYHVSWLAMESRNGKEGGFISSQAHLLSLEDLRKSCVAQLTRLAAEPGLDEPYGYENLISEIDSLLDGHIKPAKQ